jgi:hypothetical protein
MATNSSAVTREIRREIWPVLQQNGFDTFRGRSAWRHSQGKIDVVNLQSFNSYLANGVGCTTYSFSLNLGCFFTFVPPASTRVTEKDGVQLPQEFECHFRRRLQKTLRQPELRRTDTWLIKPDGKYLKESISDALTRIQVDGLSWFARFERQEEIKRTLERDDEGETWGFGTKDSPIRHLLLGSLELRKDE